MLLNADGVIERVIFVLAAGAAVLAAGFVRGHRPTRIVPVFFATMIPCVWLAVYWLPLSATPPQIKTPQKTDDEGFVSSETCRSCHPSQYASWYASYHRSMTEIASPETIRAPHESVSLTGGSRRFEVLFDQGSMYVNDVSQIQAAQYFKSRGPRLPPNFPRVQGEVMMTTGSHHMQLYWMRNPKSDGLVHLSWAWLIRDQRWVPGESMFLQPPSGPAGLFGKWERNCIRCHATGAQPRLELGGDPPLPADTRVGELGISCESCHGPAAEHVAKNKNVVRRYIQHLSGGPDPTIVNPKDLDSKRASDTCAVCHSGRVDEKWDSNTGGSFHPGDAIEDHVTLRKFEKIPEHVRPDFFWADGTSRVTGREYTGMVESGCFKNGDIGCRSCHSMHESDPNDQLAYGREGDGGCLQCHRQFENDITAHTHHPEESAGSRCYNCHMPNTTYGLMQITRSHRIDSPSARNSSHSGKPNACNLCHLDRTLEWADDALVTWYGGKPTLFSAEEREVPAAAYWLLKGDAVQRATAAWHLGWEPAMDASGTNLQPPLLARALADPYAVVRYLTERSLRKFGGYENFEYDFTLLEEDQKASEAAALAIYQSGAETFENRLTDARIERLRAERDNSDRTVRE